jgi:tRNA nucleotidyltransferase (CCA-adding enzyme)
MPERSWTGAEVRFIDYEHTIRNIRKAVAEARAAHPEIVRVFLFGSLAQGTWTADSDADLIVVVRKELTDFTSRSPYHIFVEGIDTDSLVHSENEFQEQARNPSSFLANTLLSAIEL